MRRLNDRGFAISTLLYGILTMIVLILTLLLSIMRSSYNKEKNVSEDVKYYLNKCVSKQIALENCYKEYNADKDNLHSCSDEYDSYTSCLDSSSSSMITGNVSYLSKLAIDNADMDNNGLIVDSLLSSNSNIRYIYTGASPHNYIKIGNKNGRIIAIETDGTIKVMLTDGNKAQWDKSTSSSAGSGAKRWTSSTLYNMLRNKYNSMEYTSKLAKKYYYTGVIYSNYGAKEAISNIRIEHAESNFGIVSLDDYLKASSNIKSTCDLNNTSASSIGTAMSNCSTNNWMNSVGGSGCHWTTTGYNNVNNFVTYDTSSVTAKATTTSCIANMVVYLKNSTMVNNDATGESSNPYIVDLR